MRATELLDEGVGQAGVDYENRVAQAITDANLDFLQLTKAGGAAFSSHDAADIEASLNGKPFLVECKSSTTDTMGSFLMIYRDGNFIPSSKALMKVEEEDLETALEALEERKPAIDAYLDELSTREPVQLHQLAKGNIPFIADYDVRLAMVQDGYQKAIQQMVTASSSFINNLYNSKQVYYMQVGGAGLFYMGKDIYNLGVPPYEGEVKIEIRLKAAGDSTGSISKRVSNQIGREAEYRKVDLACSGKISTKNKSPFSLDDPESIRTLFNQ
jgi:hypothetical protein